MEDSITITLGNDIHGREHTVKVSKALDSKGVPCVELDFNHAGMTVTPITYNMAHITTLERRDLPR